MPEDAFVSLKQLAVEHDLVADSDHRVAPANLLAPPEVGRNRHNFLIWTPVMVCLEALERQSIEQCQAAIVQGPHLILFHLQAGPLSEMTEITDNVLRKNSIG